MPRRGPLFPIVAELIRILVRSGMSDNEVTRRAGIARGYLSNLRYGTRNRISLSHFIWLAEVLGYDVVRQNKPIPQKARYAGQEPSQNG